MSSAPSERKSWGPLIATIDLLFLVVAFFTLLLFFVQQEREQARMQLNQVQQSLAGALPPSAATPEERSNALVELVDRLMALEKADQDRQAQAQRQDERRRLRKTVRVNYQVLPGGRIRFEDRAYTPQAFRSEVVARLRKDSWLAFRAYAPPQTPFGEVVATRKLLLENGGEFDTYWDNLAEGGAAPSGSR
jgi:hypothetical protein